MTIFSALSFQRLPPTFRRNDRANTAPVSHPMMYSSSHVHLLGGFIGSPNLIIASRNGLQAISLRAAAWASTALLRIGS